MPQKILSHAHFSTTIRTANRGIKLTSNSSGWHRLNITNYGNVNLDPGEVRQLPEINANTLYTIEVLPSGARGDIIVDY